MEPLVWQFSQRGYVVLRRFVAEDALVMLKTEASAIAATVRETGVAPEEGTHPCYDQWIAGADKVSDVIFDFARQVTVRDLAENFLGQPCVCLRASLGIRASGSPAPESMFYDQQLYLPHFGQLQAIAFWVPLDICDDRRDCLLFGDQSAAEFWPALSADAHGRRPGLGGSVPFPTFQPEHLEAGDCVAYSSYTAYRPVENASCLEQRYLIIAYRASPYRASLRACEK